MKAAPQNSSPTQTRPLEWEFRNESERKHAGIAGSERKSQLCRMASFESGNGPSWAFFRAISFARARARN